MWTSLKPTSDLQRAYHFDDYDLAANRLGKFSGHQRWRYLLRSLANHCLGLLTAALAVAIFVQVLPTPPDLGGIEIVGVFLILISTVSFVISIRPTFQNRVKAVTGLLRKDVKLVVDNLPIELVLIGPDSFYVPIPLFDTLDEHAVYQAYFLPHPERIGGNLLLSLEMIEAAPEDEE